MEEAMQEDRVRGSVYSLLANLLAAPPDTPLLELFATIDPDDAFDDAGEPGLALAWQMLRASALRCDAQGLAAEYQDLFVGVARGEVVPYSSWYVTGCPMEQPLSRLRGELRELGVERRPGVCEPEDHVAALCDTMAILISGEGAVPLSRQGEFFDRYLEPWTERFFRDLRHACSANFYRSVATLGEQFIGAERRAFEVIGPQAPGLLLPVADERVKLPRRQRA